MRVRFSAIAAAALAISLTAPAHAEDEITAKSVDEKNVVSGKTTRDPALGYIFVQAPNRVFGTFLRVPDDATLADYQADWDKAFAKAQKKYASAIVSWESQAKAAKGTTIKVPPKPVEPTRETFQIAPIDLRDMASFGPMFIFSKTDNRFNYLTALKPGTYIYYGLVMAGAGVPAAGACNCMGTVKLEVKPGMVTDLGNALYAAPRAEPPYDVATQLGMAYAEKRKAKGKEEIKPMELAFGLPDSLKDWPSEKAVFRASGKINNFFQLPITRMAPIPGVLAYRRDVAIDVVTGQDVPNPQIYSLIKKKK